MYDDELREEIRNYTSIPNEYKNIFCYVSCIFDGSIHTQKYLHKISYLEVKFKQYITDNLNLPRIDYTLHERELIEIYEDKWIDSLNEFQRRIVLFSYNIYAMKHLAETYKKCLTRYICWNYVHSDERWIVGMHVLHYIELIKFCKDKVNVEYCKPIVRSKKLNKISGI